MMRSNMLLKMVILLTLVISFRAFGDDSGNASKVWAGLNETQKEQIRGEYKEWQGLSAEEKAHLKKLYADYVNLSPQEKKQVQDNYAKFSALPLAKQSRLKEMYARFSKLSPAERHKRIEQLKEARQNLSDLRSQVEDRNKKFKK